MSLEKLAHYSLTNPASIYDEEALTALELAGRTAAKVNDACDAFNTLEKETEDHLQEQDEDIRNKFEEQDGRLSAMEETQIPETVESTFHKNVTDGTFDNMIDEYAGELTQRLDNLVNNTVEGGTTMDAEVIDARVGDDGVTYSSLGKAIRTQMKNKISTEVMFATFYIGTRNSISEVVCSDASSGGLIVKVPERLTFYCDGVRGTQYTWEEISSDIADNIVIDGNVATITIPANGYRLVFNMDDKLLHMRTCNTVEQPMDLLLVANGWSCPIGGAFMRYIDTMEYGKGKVLLETLQNAVYLGIAGSDCPITWYRDGTTDTLKMHIPAPQITIRAKGHTQDGLKWADISGNISDSVSIAEDGNSVDFSISGYGTRLVYNLTEGCLYIRGRNTTYRDDIVLIANGYGTPEGGVLMRYIQNERFVNIENKLNNVSAPSVDSATRTFSALFNNSDDMDTFAFFADPHLANSRSEGWENHLSSKLNHLKGVVNSLSLSFVMCGGDWYGMEDSQENACQKMNVIDGIMKNSFKNYKSVLGNHDTNYQGGLVEGERWTGKLTEKTYENLWFRDTNTKKAYYSFSTPSTKFYVFNTGIEGEYNEEYDLAQVAWFASNLENDESEHIALAFHIYFSTVAEDGTGTVQTVTSHIVDIANAYNNRATITFNDVDYDFSNATGKIHFALCGHTHRDNVNDAGTFPVIETLNAYLQDGGLMHFDLCFADYTNSTLHLIRVGEGENRTITI